MTWSDTPKYQLIQSPTLATRDHKGSTRQWLPILLSVFGSGMLVGAIVSFSATLQYMNHRDSALLHSTQTLTPKFTMVETSWEIDDKMWKNESLWRTGLPDGHGFIEVQNPHLYGLSLDEEFDDGDLGYYTISVFHSIHCLEKISNLFMALTSGAASPEHAEFAHLGHCLDYLRQTVMCAGDTALERARKRIKDVTLNTTNDLASGVHVCKDWNQILAFASSHAAGTSRRL